MFVRKTEPVINLIPIMNRLDQTGSKWFICAFQGCQGLITTSILSCLKILIFFWIPQKKLLLSLSNMKKKKIKLFCISYSEREYTPLHSAVQLLYYPHPPKNNNKKRLPIKLEATQMYLTLRSLKKPTLFSSDKKVPPPISPFPYYKHTFLSLFV